MKRKITRPTFIYWLVDMRPEMIASGWSRGLPFYCGKTDRKPHTRLYEHKRDASRNPYGLVGPRVVECGEHIEIQVMETIPADGNWRSKERRWIWLLRGSFPNTCNVSDGGDGASGVVRSAEWCARLSARLTGRMVSPATRALLSAINTGKTYSEETREKVAAATAARWESPEYREKMTAVSNATWANESLRADIVEGHRARWRTAEYRDKVVTRAKAARWKSDEQKQRQSAAMKAKWACPEHRARVAAAKAAKAASL